MSVQARGFLEQLKGVFETTYGSVPIISSGDMFVLPFNQNRIGSNEELLDPQTVTGHRWNVEPYFGRISVDGPVTVPYDVRNIGYWLKLLMGPPTTTGSGPYEHVFVPSNTLPSMTIETDHTDINTHHVFTGCKIDNFSTKFSVPDELVANLDIKGSKEISDNTSTLDDSASEAVFERFNTKNITLKEGGVTTGIIEEFELKISNNLADVYTLSGGNFRESLPEQDFMIEGSLKALYINDTLYNKAINGTETSIEVELTQGSHSLVFDIKELKLPRTSPERNGMVNLIEGFISKSGNVFYKVINL